MYGGKNLSYRVYEDLNRTLKEKKQLFERLNQEKLLLQQQRENFNRLNARYREIEEELEYYRSHSGTSSLNLEPDNSSVGDGLNDNESVETSPKQIDYLLEERSRVQRQICIINLIDKLNNGAPFHKLSAIVISVILRIKETAPLLKQIVRDEKYAPICSGAVWGLYHLQDSSLADYFISLLSDSREYIALYAAAALKKMNIKIPDEYNSRFQSLPALDTQRLDFLREAGFSTKDELLKNILPEMDKEIVILGIQALWDSGYEKHIPFILNFINDEDARVRYSTAVLLGTVPFTRDTTLMMEKDIRDRIIAALNNTIEHDKAFDVRRAAEESLHKLSH